MLPKGLVTSTLAWVSHLNKDPPLVGKSGVGVERFVDFHLHVEILLGIMYLHITLPYGSQCYTLGLHFNGRNSI